MDNTALFRLEYGVFMLATRYDGKDNGCITNTCIQVANDPVRIAVSVINKNYTCELLKKSGVFTVSILDEDVKFQTIKHFGMQSGRDVDKLSRFNLPRDGNGIKYLSYSTCAVLSCKVVSSEDLGTHTLFIAEVTDAKVLNQKKPLTYARYHAEVKPKPEAPKPEKKIVGWRCRICKYTVMVSELPDDFICPLCGHGKDDFEPIFEE